MESVVNGSAFFITHILPHGCAAIYHEGGRRKNGSMGMYDDRTTKLQVGHNLTSIDR